MNDPIIKFKTILLENTISSGEKITKLEANYVSQSSSRNICKDCDHYRYPNSCEIVEGFISPSGWCKYFSQTAINEKWHTTTTVSPQERGKYEGKTKSDLLRTYNALKRSGPHSRNSPEFERMRELAFAIRAKTGWGKVNR